MGGDTSRLVAALLAGVLMAAWPPSPARAQTATLPGMTFVTAPLQSPSSAQTFYGSATTHTYSLAGVTGFGATLPEIVETARALKNNADTIFDFVHDQVQTEFAFGERKGLVGTLIDKWGTPFDQNVLFVNLVRQAGYTAQYQIGQVTMTQAAFTAWTGVSDLGAACRMLSSGGIPAAFTPAAPSNCATSGAFTSVTILHVWSQVQIGGTWYAYDPSFKTYAGPAPVNLTSASGFTAGASATAAAAGMSSGTQSGANYIKAANETSLGSYLATTGTTLLNWLKANANSPALDIEQVTGINKIVQVYAPPGGWRNATPPGYTVCSVSCPIITVTYMPDQYRTKFQVQYMLKPDLVNLQTILNWTFFVDDIDGRRVGIATNFTGGINPATYITNGVQAPLNYTVASNTLTVDDTPVQTWSCTFNLSTCYGGLAFGTVSLTATHPYMTTFANQSVTKQVGASALPVAIISGWGMITPARLAKWSGEVNEDTALPAGSVIPWLCNGQGEYCTPPYSQSAGDLTRQKLAASWLAQTTRMMQIQAAIAGAKVEHQHSIGVVDWQASIQGHQFPPPSGNLNGPNYYGVSDEFTELNIDTTVSVTSQTNNAAKVAALSRSIALAAGTLEGSVLDQMEDLPDSASTASRVAWGNNPGADNQTGDDEDPCWISPSNPRQFFDFTGTSSTTRNGLYQVEGSTTGCTSVPPVGYVGFSPGYFTGSAESAISQYLAQGFHVTSSAETFLGPGARAGACQGTVAKGVSCDPSHQRGDAVVATLFDGSGNVLEAAHVLTNVVSTGGPAMSKGGGGKQPENFAQYDPAKAADVLKDRFVDRSVALGVDLKTGTAGYTTPTLLSIGAGQAPYKLDYALTFKAATTGCNDYGPCVGPISGGWNQDWDVRLNLSGSGEEALGATSPYEAAGTLVAFLAMQDIFGQTALVDPRRDIMAALAADWWRGQIVGNAVTINRGFAGQQYVRLVDGSWMPPIGSPGVFTQTGARVKTRLPCHPSFGAGDYSYSTSRTWVNDAVSFSLRNAAGDVLASAPWKWRYDQNQNDNCAEARGYEPTTWTWPQGASLTFTYGTQSGGVTVDYTTGVTAIATSLGRSMTFGSGTAATNGVTVGLQSNTSISDAVSAPSGGNTGHFWNFAYTALQPRTATQRPVPYAQLLQVFNPVSATLPALQYGYDTRGVVKTAYDANGLQVPANAGLPPYQWYLALGGRGERDDPNGGAYTVWYDTDGDEVRNIDEIGREVDSTWDGRHRVATRTFPEADQEVFAYDGSDNVTALVNWPKPGSPLSPTTVTASYEPTWNHLATITDALGHTTSFAYYASGSGASLMQTATRPVVGGVAPVYSFTYNAIGLPTQTVDPAAVTTTHVYDGFGNLTSTTEGAAGGSNPIWGTAQWSATGPAKWGTPALNLTTTFTPDSWGNITAVTDPLSHVANATFDLDRRKLLAIEPYPGSGTRTATNTIYDANGRVVEVDRGTTNSSGGSFTSLVTTTTAFDPNGDKTQVSVLNGPFGSAALSVTQTSYDALNRPICTAERENAAVFASLPANACLQSAGSSVGPDHITQLTYDLAGQKLVETRGLGTSIQGPYATYTYGLDGELATVLDANNNLTTNLYDGLNRLAKVEYPVTTIGQGASDPNDAESYSYDANGNRLTLTKRDLTTTISFGYDPLNRMVSKTFASPNAAADVGYYYDRAGRPTNALFGNVSGTPGVTWAYDAAGRRISEATNGRTLAFTYDANSNPATLTWPDALSITYVFDAANRFSSVGSTPATVVAGYDPLSRLTTLNRASGSSTIIGLDAADRMTSLAHAFTPTTGNETWGYSYTPASQLTTTTSTNGVFDWNPAAAAAVNTVADGLNRNATVAGVGQTYDAFGNLTSDGTRTFTYDTENRLLTETGPVTLALSYDPMGRLQQSVINGTTTVFLYDGDALVGEYPASGNTPLRRYVHGPGVDNPLIWYEGGSMTTSNANYLITDRQGSTVGTANTSGTVTATYEYDAYGAPNAWGTVGSSTRFRYTGQAAIPEAQLYYYKARVYDPVFGRFLQTDPVGYGPDVNWYAYVGNDPTNASDPSGEDPTGGCTGSNIGCGGGTAASASGSSTFGAGHDLPTLASKTAVQAVVGRPVSAISSKSDDTGIIQLAAEHTKGARPSTTPKHEEGEARKAKDRGGEKGDAARDLPRKRPYGFKGPYPPKPNPSKMSPGPVFPIIPGPPLFQPPPAIAPPPFPIFEPIEIPIVAAGQSE